MGAGVKKKLLSLTCDVQHWKLLILRTRMAKHLPVDFLEAQKNVIS